MEPELIEIALAVKGFMPPDEGLALHAAGAGHGAVGPLLEVGAYCGKSAVYLGSAARAAGTVLVSIDHHRGSEENQAGWEHHDTEVVDPATGRMDTLPFFRRTIERAGLEDVVVPLITTSDTAARFWNTPLGLLFIDGGHAEDVAQADYDNWAHHVAPGGALVFHDIFPDPADGGQAPYRVYRRALETGRYQEKSVTGSLRVLERLP